MKTFRAWSLRGLVIAALGAGSSCYYPIGPAPLASSSKESYDSKGGGSQQVVAWPVVSVTPVVISYPYCTPYTWGPRYYRHYRGGYCGPRYYRGHGHYRR